MPIGPRLTRGTLLLHQHGLAVHEVASTLRCSSPTVSHWLSGRNQPPEKLFTAVSLLVGEDTAAELRTVLSEPSRP